MRGHRRTHGRARGSRSATHCRTRSAWFISGKYYPPSPGGIEGHTQTLARGQAALGADVRVLVVNHAAADGRDATFDRFTATPDAEDTDGAVRITRVGRRASIAKLDITPGLLGAIRRLGRTKPDIWHLHAPNVTMMLAVLCSPRIRPLVITHHSDIVRQRVLKYAVRPIERAAYRRAARMLSDSPGLRRWLGFAEDSTDEGRRPLPLGIDLEPFQNPSAAAVEFARGLREKHGSPLWLSVGRLDLLQGFARRTRGAPRRSG